MHQKNRKNKRYNQAVEYIDNGKYNEAYNLLKDLNYKNSGDLAMLINAGNYLHYNNYEEAIDIVYNLGGTTTINYGGEDGVAIIDREVDIIKKQHVNNEASALGKEFVGWDVESYEIDFKKYDLDLKLKAKFDDILYNIVYTNCPDNMVSDLNLPTTFVFNGSKIRIPNGVKKGYTFLGWKKNGMGECIKDYIFNPSVLSDVILEAQWQANKYTITIDVNGGPELAETEFEVTQGESFTLSIPGEREGFTFVGYGTCIIDKYGKTHNFPETNAQGESLKGYNYGSDVTLKALWEGKKYNVTIKVSGSAWITIPNSTPTATDDETIFIGETKVKTIQCGDSITLEYRSIDSISGWYVDDVYVSRALTFTFTVPPHDSVIELK